MHPLEKRIDTIAASSGLLPEGGRVVVAVSAGPDSTALFHLLAALRPRWRFELIAAYADHGLRPAETPAEAATVRAMAERLAAKAEFGSLPVERHAAAHGLSLEEAARELRYRFLEGVAARYQADCIAVGHTADDQAEEVLLRLIRGSGRMGLAGMALLRQGRIIRPLITTAKAEILAYLTDRGIAFCEDSSNRDRRYLRNRVRHELLPLLRERFNPNIGQTLRQTAAILQDEEAFLEEAATAAGEPMTSRRRSETGPVIELDAAAFLEQPRALARRVLENICWEMGQRPSFRRIEQLRALAATAGKRLHLAGGLRVRHEGGMLIFSYPRGREAARGDLEPAAAAFQYTLPGPGSYPLPEIGRRLVIELYQGKPGPEELRAGGVDWLDADSVDFPLTVRTPRPGDRFRPLGAPGSKKIGDFLTDHKVPRNQRRQLAVLASGPDIVALLEHRIDHRFRLTDTTGRTLKIWLEPL